MALFMMYHTIVPLEKWSHGVSHEPPRLYPVEYPKVYAVYTIFHRVFRGTSYGISHVQYHGANAL